MSIYAGKTNEDCQNEVKDEDDVGWVGDAEEEEEEEVRLASVASLLRGFNWRAPALANNPHLSAVNLPSDIYIP